MGLRGRIETSTIGRIIWPEGRPREARRSTRNGAIAWFADALRSMRGKEAYDTLPRSLNAPRANVLGAKLWRGFSADASRELEALCRSGAEPQTERCAGAWYLAEWSYFRQDMHAALAWLEFMSGLDPHWRLAKPSLILQVESQLALGRFADAERLLAEAAERYGDDADLWLLSSNVLRARRATDAVGPEADEQRVALINRMFGAAGLMPIRRIDAARPLQMDNISGNATAGPKREAGGPRISVVMPAYNAEETIDFALAGLSDQTWRDLEVIVVDDGSTDRTCEMVERRAALDPRIRLVRSQRNVGPYVARNLGASLAGGEFVTVHDADDWSHPQKLEVQITSLLRTGAVANMSGLIRMTAELQARHLSRARSRFSHANQSSLLLRKATLAEFGGWDPVRFSGDYEFVRRIVRKHGARRVQWMSRTPLSFGLVRAESLTGSGASHINSLLFGSRHEYHRSFIRWHAKAHRSGNFRLDLAPDARRPFPAPAPMLEQAADKTYDAILAGDLALRGDSLAAVAYRIGQALDAGLRLGVFHWPRYELDIERDIDERIAVLIDEFRLDMIVADQAAAARDLVFFDPAVLPFGIDRVPHVSFQNLYVTDWVGGAAQAAPGGVSAEARENLERLFGAAAEWLPDFSIGRVHESPTAAGRHAAGVAP